VPTERQVSMAQFRAHLDAIKVGRGINEVVVHHTWRPSASDYRGIETVRGVRNYHTGVRGWSDNGYHVMFGPDGAIFLCRPMQRSGAHVLNRNAHTIGVSFIANFDSDEPASYAGMGAGQGVVAALLERFDLSVKDIRFHREFAGKTCPGLKLGLARFRQDVQSVMEGETMPEEIDVDAWALPAVERMQAAGIMAGKSADWFGGREPITRQEVAVVADRIVRLILQRTPDA